MNKRIDEWIWPLTCGLLAALALTAFAAPASAFSRAEIMRMVVEEANATGVPPALALAVARIESGFDPRAESPKGARGVMQIMPRTGRDVYGVDPDELWDPRLNIQIGIDFLEQLIERYDGRWDLALSYYNGGSGVGDLPDARVLAATRSYVDSVLGWHQRYNEQAVVWRDEPGPNDDWTPARTHVAALEEAGPPEAPARGPVEVHVRWYPAVPAGPQVVPRPAPFQPRPGTLDDFDETIGERLAAARQRLSDVPVLARNEG